MNKIETIEGYCEYLSDTTSINVKYVKVLTLGSIPQAKAISFYCAYSSECNLEFDCPVFKIASDICTW